MPFSVTVILSALLPVLAALFLSALLISIMVVFLPRRRATPNRPPLR